MNPLLLSLACALKTRPDPVLPESSQDSASMESIPKEPQSEFAGLMHINEAVSENHGSLEDAEGNTPDWVELLWLGETTLSLEGWYLTDGAGNQKRLSGQLAPAELVVFFADESFALKAAGDKVFLWDSTGRLVDTLSLPALGPDQSAGLSEPLTETVLISKGSSAQFSIAPEGSWTEPDYPDQSWESVFLPIGFDLSITGTETELANGRPTEQSSNGYGFTGLQAVDGDPMTFSHTGDADLNPWWQVELEADAAISRIELINRADCCSERLYNITVSVLDAFANTVWTSVLLNPTTEGMTPVSPGDRLELSLPGNTIGRSIRISKQAVNGSDSSEWLSLAEVAAFGSVVSPYTSLIATPVEAAGGLRIPFLLEQAFPTRLLLQLSWDDAFSAWLDGELVAEDLPDLPHDGFLVMDYLLPTLPAGEHLLALEGSTLDPEDFLLAPTLVAQWFTPGESAFFPVPTPGQPNGTGYSSQLSSALISPPRGFYTAPQTITLTAPEAGSSLIYTLDGSLPTPTHGSRLDPASLEEQLLYTLSVSTTATLRVLAIKDGHADSPVATHSYLFLEDVVQQPALPASFPSSWISRSEGSFAADYEMDPELIADPAFKAELLEGLRDIPSMSIVMEPADLFEENGIYANSAERGDDWERRASIELILPDGSTGFVQDAALQIHGYGWRYHSSTLKHSFRIQFKAEYGASKLEYPLFKEAPVTRFDSIVLRAGGSKTWLDFRDPENAQYLHDAFARDTAYEMGKIDGHATYVHLYLNGLYWGLYMPVERPDAGFAEEYFGGDDADYDAINRRTTTNEAIDGDLEAYNTMLALGDGDLTSAEGLAALEEYLDIADLIDWMLIHQYMTNQDGPCCFYGNNQRGIRKCEAGAGYRFFVWDMEYSLWNASDSTNIVVDVEGHASHLYTRLQSNADFRAQYSARAQELLTAQGALTPALSAARYEKRAQEIYRALLGESARWGDTYRQPAYTRDIEWQIEYDRLMNEYFPYRTDHMINQLRAIGLYP